MKNYLFLILFVCLVPMLYATQPPHLLFYTQNISQKKCDANNIPSIKRMMEDIEVIAGNITIIQATKYFKGVDLNYMVTANPHSVKNKIKIDQHAGELSLDLNVQDNFNVTITASNTCGSVSSTFNVQIDEED